MLERFTFRDVSSAYSSFLEHSGLQECVILQTCNRVELFGIGNGKAASLVAKSLKKRNIEFFVTSRTYDRAQSFAETVGGNPIKFENAISKFNEVDVLFVATVAPYFLVTYDRIKEAMTSKKTGM